MVLRKNIRIPGEINRGMPPFAVGGDHCIVCKYIYKYDTFVHERYGVLHNSNRHETYQRVAVENGKC